MNFRRVKEEYGKLWKGRKGKRKLNNYILVTVTKILKNPLNKKMIMHF